jgi:hypothetical protein
MFDRHAFGDLALAVLLALPIASLAHSPAAVAKPTHVSAGADRNVSNGRISLLG